MAARMQHPSSKRYLPLRQSETGEVDVESRQQRGGDPRRLPILLVTVAAFLLGMGAQYMLTMLRATDWPHEKTWAPGLRPSTAWAKFEGRLMTESPYRGTPNASIDAAWARYTESRWFSGGSVLLGVTEEDIRRSGKMDEEDWFNSTVRLAEHNGGGYMATLEMFHQLHCLDMLRKYSYRDLYPPETFPPDEDNRSHLDHCIEMIRQVIMCHADTGLVTFHWVEDRPQTVPDFSTWHRCRNPEDVLRWAQEHQAPMTRPISKPSGIIRMPSLEGQYKASV